MLEWIVETTLVAAGIALVALIASRLRSIGPAVRHALWLVVLIKLITPPVVSWPWATTWGALDWPITLGQVVPGTSGKTFADPDQPQSARPNESRVVQFVSKHSEPADLVTDDNSPQVPALQPKFEVTAVPGRVSLWAGGLPEQAVLVRWIASAWLVISVVLGVGQTIRIIRFRRRLVSAIPAPEELIEAADCISQRLGISTPELLVVSELGTPLL